MVPAIEVDREGFVRSENVLADISESVFLNQALLAGNAFIRKRGLNARCSPAKFVMWSYEASKYQPALIIELSTDVDEEIKEAIGELVRNKPRTEGEAAELAREGIPFLCSSEKDRLVLILPERILKIAMRDGFVPVPGVDREELTELKTKEFWPIVAQEEPANFFGLGEATKESILKTFQF